MKRKKNRINYSQRFVLYLTLIVQILLIFFPLVSVKPKNIFNETSITVKFADGLHLHQGPNYTVLELLSWATQNHHKGSKRPSSHTLDTPGVSS